MTLFIKDKLAADINQMALAGEADLFEHNPYQLDTIANVITYAVYGYIASCNPSLCEWAKIERDVRLLVDNRCIGDPLDEGILAIIDTYLKE